MPSGPYCYLSVSSIWSTFSSNLRELAISVSYSKALADLLPSQTRPLPKLEVMRMGYLYRPWVSHPTEVGHSDLMLERLAQLYTNQPLQVLELQILYPRQLSSSGGPSLAESLLPKRHIFPQLRSFWIITKRANIDPTQTSHISSFIRAHASTLRSLKIHKFQAVIKDLFVNTPNFPLQPSFSIAFNNIAVLSLNPSALTKITLIELQMPFICRLPPHCPFQDLLRLQICVNTIRLDCFDQWAKQLPQLISLSVRYWEEDSNITTKISSRITNTPNPTLSHWGLKDLALYWEFHAMPMSPSYTLMQQVAQLIPSVESFTGRGDMSELHEHWEVEWPWSRNVYIDALMDEKPK